MEAKLSGLLVEENKEVRKRKTNMVNYDLVFMFVFIALLLVLYVRNRKNIQFQGLMALYRTKLGINFSKKAAGRFPRFFRYFGYLSIILGFVGMIIISYVLVTGGINLLTKPNAQPVVAPVLPFVHIPGLPTLLFTYWIIGIFVVAVIHE
ncbi:MAG: hypothetical protein AABX59_00155, partial [Nanoarchaeota archaeon]